MAPAAGLDLELDQQAGQVAVLVLEVVQVASQEADLAVDLAGLEQVELAPRAVDLLEESLPRGPPIRGQPAAMPPSLR